jgi:cytidylate kinase
MTRARRLLQGQRRAETGDAITPHGERQAQAVDTPFPAPSPPAFTVALSREAGANGALVARAVGERLGWSVYDRELLERVAAEMGQHATLLESLDERRQSWLAECLESFSSTPAVSEDSYVRHLLATVLALAAHGDCVIIGRGVPQVLPAATTLRVRVVAPLDVRVEAIRQRLGLDRAAAARWVEKTDDERARFVRYHFHKDPADPCGYDLILNSGRFAVAECSELIVEALHRLQAHAPAPHAELAPASAAARART